MVNSGRHYEESKGFFLNITTYKLVLVETKYWYEPENEHDMGPLN